MEIDRKTFVFWFYNKCFDKFSVGRYISMFEESGMEVYKTKGSVFFNTE